MELVKIDVFVATDEKLHRLQLERREAVPLGASAHPVHFTSAEDTILAKLIWYRRSDHVLERQLRDVAGILKTRGRTLDFEVLRPAATILGVGDLLTEALATTGYLDET